MKPLPYHTYQFTLFCDNLFGNPKLFSLLRGLGIGACGTARRQVTKPVFGNIDDWNAPWGALRSKEVPTTLVSIWQDSNKVGFCTTIHDGTEWPVRNRKRPKGTSTSAAITKQPFYMFSPPSRCKEPYEHTRLLPIPGAIDDYNHYMGGVDIADQLRAGFSTQQRGVKPWRPLFYWLLDSTIINAFRLSEHQRKSKLDGGKDKVRNAHWAFREALVSELLKDPFPATPKQLYITQKTLLPQIRLTRPIEIHQMIRGPKAVCLYCRWCRANHRGRTPRIITKSNNMPKSRTLCSHCNISLCKVCFLPFHYTVA
jgi:hypothetical protein